MKTKQLALDALKNAPVFGPRSEQYKNAIAALEADIAQAVEPVASNVTMKEVVRLRVLAESARHGTWSIDPHFGTLLYALKPDTVDADEIGDDAWVAQKMTKGDADYLWSVQPSKLLDLLDRLNLTTTPPEPAVNAELVGYTGMSDEVDFSTDRWTFLMDPGYRVGAGQYLITKIAKATS